MVKARWCFFSLITLCCFVCMVLTLRPNIVANPVLRSSIFSCFILSFLAPLLYVSINYNAEISLPPDFGHLFLVAGIYFAGCIFYLTKVPERWIKDGKVDYIGSSHNIFHVMVMIGISLDITYSC